HRRRTGPKWPFAICTSLASANMVVSKQWESCHDDEENSIDLCPDGTVVSCGSEGLQHKDDDQRTERHDARIRSDVPESERRRYGHLRTVAEGRPHEHLASRARRRDAM